MCNGQFEESHTFQIRLPEDSPQVIEALVEYLYSGNFRDNGTVARGGDTETATERLANIYCVAEKYGLEDLKVLVVRKLADVTDVKDRPTELFSEARKIYARIPDSDDIYPAFFKDQLMKMAISVFGSESVRQNMDECISAGSTLATDISDVIYRKYDASIRCVKAQQEEVRKTKLELETMTRQMERYRDRLHYLNRQ